MRSPRIYVPAPWSDPAADSNEPLRLFDERAHYLVRVLRRREDDEVIAFDGEGLSQSTRVAAIRKHEVELQRFADPQREDPALLQITLGLALLKGDALDTALQKATELGVARIQLFESARCERKLETGARLQRQLQHWRGILIAAAEQCGRSFLPTLLPPVAFAEYSSAVRAPESDCWLFDPKGETLPTRLDRALLECCIGPEGGFTEDELILNRRNGGRCFRVGPRILRADTAPVVIITAVQLLYGDLR